MIVDVVWVLVAVTFFDGIDRKPEAHAGAYYTRAECMSHRARLMAHYPADGIECIPVANPKEKK